MRKRIAYSQNFLKDNGLISALIERSSIDKDDIVYEIGAGQGIITEELLKRSSQVVAFEIDSNLCTKLLQRFQDQHNLELKRGDFLNYALPNQDYKIFSNIPFNITSAIVKKITQESNPPKDAYLIVQKEAAKKFVGKPYDNKNSQLAVLLKPWFEISVAYEFNRNDFFPKPSVDTVLIRIKLIEKSIVDLKARRQYEDFVTYAFNQFRPNIKEGLSKVLGNQVIVRLASELKFSPNSKPSELRFEDWIGLFDFFLNKLDRNHQDIVSGAYASQLKQQSQLEKINRTRTDRNWQQFKK